MHLVDEEHGALALLAQAALGLGQGLAHVLHAGGRGRQRGQVLGGGVGQQAGQGGLAGAGGAPQDRRPDPVGLGQQAQGGTGADEVLLAHDLIEGAGAETGCQRRLALEAAVGGVGEEAQGGGPALGGCAGGTTTRMPSSARLAAGSGVGAPVKQVGARTGSWGRR